MKYKLTAMLLTGTLLLPMTACRANPPAADNTAGAPVTDTAEPAAATPEGALVLAEQGMFSAGGIVIES